MTDKPHVHSKIKELKEGEISMTSFHMPYMDEMDPDNPYGPNYSRLTHSTKKYYKLLKIKQYVHLQPQDSSLLRQADIILYGSLLLGAFVGLAVGKLGHKTFLKKNWNGMARFVNKYP
jgi:hypothetical protein